MQNVLKTVRLCIGLGHRHVEKMRAALKKCVDFVIDFSPFLNEFPSICQRFFVTQVLVSPIKSKPHNRKNINKSSKYPKISESVQTHSNAFKCTQMHPIASERVRTLPNRSEHVRNFKKRQKCRKLHENFAKTSRSRG